MLARATVAGFILRAFWHRPLIKPAGAA